MALDSIHRPAGVAPNLETVPPNRPFLLGAPAADHYAEALFRTQHRPSCIPIPSGDIGGRSSCSASRVWSGRWSRRSTCSTGAAPQGLKAHYISVATSSMYAGGSYIGGAFRKADVENWMTGNKYDPQALQIARDHPNDDDYWAKFDTTKRFDRMNVPAVHVGGWFDMFLQGTIDQFTGRQHHGAPGAKGTQKLVIGSWQHAIGKMPAGQLTFPNATSIPHAYDALRWFTHYLNGTDNSVEKEPAVA